MTTATAPADQQARLDRFITLAAKMLRASGTSYRDRKPATAQAFGKALAATEPGSPHGRVLAAALKPARWDSRPQAQRIVLGLARAGVTPTEAALSARLDQIDAKRARIQREREEAMVTAARHREEALVLADRDGPAASAYVARIVEETGDGPAYSELSSAMGWPRNKIVRERAVRQLIADGFMRGGVAPRSLRAGTPPCEKLLLDL